MYVRRGLKTEAVHPVEYSLTDLFHGVKNKAQVWVFAGLKEAKERFPFKILEIDSENGSEFINGHLFRYCRENKITFTPWNRKDGDIPRGEPGVDRTGRTTTALFKQKNYSVVRRAVGYRRHDTAEELEVLNELYDHLRLYTNFF